MTEYSRLKTSRSAAIRATLDYPVIDTDVHTNDFTPAFEDYIANYGGAKLVDELRKTEASRLNSKATVKTGINKPLKNVNTTGQSDRLGGLELPKIRWISLLTPSPNCSMSVRRSKAQTIRCCFRIMS